MTHTHETLEKLEEVLCKEIDETIVDGKVNEPKLAVLDKAVDILKDIEEITHKGEYEANNGYSERYPDYMRRNSYGRYDRDYDRRSSYDYSPYERASYDNNGMRQQLEKLMQKAQTEQDRDEIREMIRKLER